MNLLVLLLVALPACLAQFSIQGPSDGNRVAQGLRVEEGKGIEYTNQNAGHEGGFSIQGASDGNANIQSGSDGHSNFHIQGASHGGAERYTLQGPVTGAYNIQGATAEHQSGIIQGPYEGDGGQGKSLQYNDPSGLRVNWRSYDRRVRPSNHQQQQQQLQYSEPAVASVQRPDPRQRAYSRQPQAPQQPQYQSQPSLLPAKPLNSAPTHVQQLLQFQSQIPYLNIIPQQFRYDGLIGNQGGHQGQAQPQYDPQPQEQPIHEQRRPSYRGKPHGSPRQKRQAPQHRQQAQQQQHRRIPQPPSEPAINYNPNLPPQLQQLLKFQAQAPYVNVIPEQYRFNPEPVAQAQLQEFQKHYQNLVQQQPSSPTVHTVEPAQAPRPVARPGPNGGAHQRQRRQAYPGQGHQRPAPQQIPAEPVPQYSTNIPGHLQSLLKYQSQIPYNIIANQITYRLDKPYVPQPAQQASSSQVQYQGQGQGGDSYQSQLSRYEQAYPTNSDYSQYSQQQPGYQQSGGGVRPVTENQY